MFGCFYGSRNYDYTIDEKNTANIITKSWRKIMNFPFHSSKRSMIKQTLLHITRLWNTDFQCKIYTYLMSLISLQQLIRGVFPTNELQKQKQKPLITEWPYWRLSTRLWELHCKCPVVIIVLRWAMIWICSFPGSRWDQDGLYIRDECGQSCMKTCWLTTLYNTINSSQMSTERPVYPIHTGWPSGDLGHWNCLQSYI